MSFGCSVSDFVALGQLAWKIYKSCKEAPEGFKNVTQEVLSLHAVLKEVEETNSDANLSVARRARLKIVRDGCGAALEDLQGTLDKYNSLGTGTKRTWHRLGWGSKNIEQLRSRLISNTLLLTSFVNSSQITVEKKLDVFMQEFRDGMRERSVVSTQTVDSLSNDERQAWRAIRKELEDIGISAAAFDANKDFILDWFTRAKEAGAFEEQRAEDSSSSIFCEDNSSQSSEFSGQMSVSSQLLADPEHDTNLTSTSVDIQVSKLSPKAKFKILRFPRVASPTCPSFCDIKGWEWEDWDIRELFTAVQTEDETKVRQLLDNGVSINVKDVYGRTALHLAVLSKLEGMVQLLLSMGADINANNNHKATALHLAVEQGYEETVQFLLKNGAKIEEKDKDECTVLHLAAKSGHKTTVQLLLKYGAKIEETDWTGSTALLWATINGCESVVQALLNNGAKIDSKDNMGNTALHCAATNGHEMVMQLLENGACIDEKNETGKTALHWAAKFGKETVAELLLKNGAKVNEGDRNGDTALHWAAIPGHKTMVQLLLNNGANINEKHRGRYTALHIAAKSENKPMVLLLLRNGAKIAETDRDVLRTVGIITHRRRSNKKGWDNVLN